MGRVWKRPVMVLSGLLWAAMYAMPQAYTVSAKPGAVNYIEGNAFLNSQPISDKGLKSVFLNANDVLSTDIGKAEVLLTPGVFLRLGDNSQVRMVSPSLTDTQVEVSRGEAMVEVSGLIKGNSIQVLDHGSSTVIEKNGLYRFTADDPPVAAVLDGRASVAFGEHKVDLKKGRQVVLAENLKAEKFDNKKEDNLYAWSNVRSEYEAAASYRVAQTAYNSSAGGWQGFGYNGFTSPGWYWDNGFSSWAWLPGAGAFYSPFGYGFYSPGLVAYAPVIVAPVRRGGLGFVHNPGQPYVPGQPGNGWRGHPHPPTAIAGGNGIITNVPISPRNPPAMGVMPASPWANQAARSAAARSMMESGFRTGSGTPAPNLAGRGPMMHPGGGPAGGWHGGGGAAGGGGWHGNAQGGGGYHGGGAPGGGFHGGGMAGGGGGGHAAGGAHR